MQESIYQCVSTALKYAFKNLNTIKNGGEVIYQGEGFGDANNDTEIKADSFLGEMFREHFLARPWCCQVTVEGLGRTEKDSGEFEVYVDPLDNSLGYKANQNTITFPFSACVHIIPKGKRKFRDIIAGAVMDLRNGDLWYGEKSTEDGIYCSWLKCRSWLNNRPLMPSNTPLDVGARNDIILTDLYYRENREILLEWFPEGKGIFRNTGSAALEMVYPTLDIVALYFCASQKMHELGAAYIINKGAGRLVKHLFEWKDLAEYEYNFDEQMPVVIMRNEEVEKDIYSRLKEFRV